MRIGIDGRLWGETGVGRYIRNLVGQLTDIDKDNEYVLFVKSSDVESIKYQVLSIKYAKNWKIVTADIRWHTIKEQLRLPTILEKEKLDLVHFPYFSVPIFYKGRFVVTIHDLIIHHFDTGLASSLPLPFYKAKRLGYKFVLRQTVKKASKIIAVSNATKEEIVKHLGVEPLKVAVTYEGVDKNLYSSSESANRRTSREVDSGQARMTMSSRLRSNDNFFLYVGNAYPHKNLERLLEAFAKIRMYPNDFSESTRMKRNSDSFGVNIRMNSDVKLVLVGKEDYFYARLKEKVEEMGLEEHVIFHVPKDDSELAWLYQNAIALVIPSLMEGFGLPALEAMANGCLVLASDIAALRETCEEAAIYFNPYDVDDIVAKLNNVIVQSNSLDYRTKRENGIARVRLFSWKKMAEETLRVYEEVVSSSVIPSEAKESR